MNLRLDPDPETPLGAMLYTVLGGLIVEAVLILTHHIHLYWA